MNVSIIYSNRKSISIEVKSEDEILIRAPRYTSKRQINYLLKRKADWIEKVIRSMPKRQVFETGETVYYLGNPYVLQVLDDTGYKRSKVFLTQDEIVVDCGSSQKSVEELLENWYRKEARMIIEQRVQHYSSQISSNYNNIYIKEQKTRWGSCSSKGNLNFNWKVVKKPLEVIDYLVVHEMCHLLYMNHSRQFWQKVESVLPDYRERKRLLMSEQS